MRIACNIPTPDAAVALGFPGTLTAIGEPSLLATPLVALLCSKSCPGNLILQAYDLAVALRDAAIPTIGGFHTPLERECLDFLLRGQQPVVVCPARGITGMRLPKEWRAALEQERLLLVSAFPEAVRRPTADTADSRNRLVIALATKVLVIHANPGGRAEALVRHAAALGKPTYALADPANAHLPAIGVAIPDLAHRIIEPPPSPEV